MITRLKWLPRRAAALIAAAVAAAALAVALAHPSTAPARYGAAGNGVIRADGIQGSGAVHPITAGLPARTTTGLSTRGNERSPSPARQDAAPSAGPIPR